jgi:hypothetical protein
MQVFIAIICALNNFMIVKVKDVILAVVVPQKCGISTVTNILAYHLTNQSVSKTKCRRTLSRAQCLINPGQLEEQFYIKWANPKPDYVFAVVRDPIQRLLSAYRDRVYTKNIDQFDNPTWEWFCNNFKDIVFANTDVGRHCRPQTEWFGKNVSLYDQVFYTKDINTKLKPIVENITGISIPDLYSNASQHVELNISDQQVNFFKNYYKWDYEFISQAQNLSKFS